MPTSLPQRHALHRRDPTDAPSPQPSPASMEVFQFLSGLCVSVRIRLIYAAETTKFKKEWERSWKNHSSQMCLPHTHYINLIGAGGVGVGDNYWKKTKLW